MSNADGGGGRGIDDDDDRAGRVRGPSVPLQILAALLVAWLATLTARRRRRDERRRKRLVKSVWKAGRRRRRTRREIEWAFVVAASVEARRGLSTMGKLVDPEKSYAIASGALRARSLAVGKCACLPASGAYVARSWWSTRASKSFECICGMGHEGRRNYPRENWLRCDAKAADDGASGRRNDDDRDAASDERHDCGAVAAETRVPREGADELPPGRAARLRFRSMDR